MSSLARSRRRNPTAELQRSTEGLEFFRAWLRSPQRIAAVAPSGAALARLITSEISQETGPVIELGPGTGAFTRALIERGVPPEDLALIEAGTEFIGALRTDFPRVRTLCLDATRLGRIELFGGKQAGAAISGLPVLTMSARQVIAILNGVFRRMRADGSLYQFTYFRGCPVPRRLLEHLGLEAERIGGTLANLPPAAVYRIRRSARRG